MQRYGMAGALLGNFGDLLNAVKQTGVTTPPEEVERLRARLNGWAKSGMGSVLAMEMVEWDNRGVHEKPTGDELARQILIARRKLAEDFAEMVCTLNNEWEKAHFDFVAGLLIPQANGYELTGAELILSLTRILRKIRPWDEWRVEEMPRMQFTTRAVRIVNKRVPRIEAPQTRSILDLFLPGMMGFGPAAMAFVPMAGFLPAGMGARRPVQRKEPMLADQVREAFKQSGLGAVIGADAVEEIIQGMGAEGLPAADKLELSFAVVPDGPGSIPLSVMFEDIIEEMTSAPRSRGPFGGGGMGEMMESLLEAMASGFGSSCGLGGRGMESPHSHAGNCDACPGRGQCDLEPRMRGLQAMARTLSRV